jgi:beta-lactamase class D
MGTVVDRFWLDGPLEISALEQARFVARLAQGRLPLSERSQRIVRQILRAEEKDGTAIFAKTGWFTGPTPPMIGWWVGWVEREGRVYSFALNIDMASAEDTPKRLLIGRSLLAQLGVLATP